MNASHTHAALSHGQDTPQPATSQPQPSPHPTTKQALTTERKEDRPPIVTYPEFLTKPAQPPPLMTANGFLNTIYAFGGLSTLLYGTSKFVVEPMVQSLTEARISLHDSAKQDLEKLVDKLESIVSEIPAAAKKNQLVHTGGAGRDGEEDNDDAKSSYEDPAELFHRDIGVQTSLPSSPVDPTAPFLAS